MVPAEIGGLRAFKMPKIKGSDSVKRRATWVLLMPIFSGEPARPKIAGLYEHVVLSSLAESTSQPGVRLYTVKFSLPLIKISIFIGSSKTCIYGHYRTPHPHECEQELREESGSKEMARSGEDWGTPSLTQQVHQGVGAYARD